MSMIDHHSPNDWCHFLFQSADGPVVPTKSHINYLDGKDWKVELSVDRLEIYRRKCKNLLSFCIIPQNVDGEGSWLF